MGLNLVLVSLGDPDRLTGGNRYNRLVVERAARHDARISLLSADERPWPRLLSGGPRLLARALAAHPDALLVDSLVTAALALPVTARRPPVPVIGLLHQPPGGVGRPDQRARLQAALDRRFDRAARALIVPGESLAAELRATGIPAERIRVVPPGTELAEPAAGIGLGSAARPAFLCVANWVPNKGLHLLLDAFGHLPGSAGSLHLVGDPAVDPAYARKLRARLGLADLLGRVVVHGRRSPEEVAALYAAADVFVLPSLGETYGMAFAEALAAGLPCVGFRVGHLPDLVQDGVSGYLIEAGDIPALTAALERLATDAALRRGMADAARRAGQALPSWDDTAAGVLAVVRAALDGPDLPSSEGDA